MDALGAGTKLSICGFIGLKRSHEVRDHGADLSCIFRRYFCDEASFLCVAWPADAFMALTGREHVSGLTHWVRSWRDSTHLKHRS